MGNLLRNSVGHLLRNSAGHLLRSAGDIFWFNFSNGSGFTSHAEAASGLLAGFNYALSIPPAPDYQDYESGWAKGYKDIFESVWAYWIYNDLASASAACRVIPVSSRNGLYLSGISLWVSGDIKSGGGAPMIGVATGSADSPQTSQYSDLLGVQSMDITSWMGDYYYGTFNFTSPILLSDYLYVYFFFAAHCPPTASNGDSSSLFWDPTTPVDLIFD
jgi:hypothetical protein